MKTPRLQEQRQRRCLPRTVLHLVLTHHWYDLTERGEKRIEYRVMTPRWKRLIWDRRDAITHIRFSRGYTKRTIEYSVEKIDVGTCPTLGWSGDFYRIHFSQNDQGQTRSSRTAASGTSLAESCIAKQQP